MSHPNSETNNAEHHTSPQKDTTSTLNRGMTTPARLSRAKYVTSLVCLVDTVVLLLVVLVITASDTRGRADSLAVVERDTLMGTPSSMSTLSPVALSL
eukprot:CAMPEP_0114478484 /NCGR_PEP_ID=MMETSP0104-20121206/16011_1 /TAXON_ID=37642 ORGANISM="Paraphysomonas imperforata, Strain PA2" /NCGR_SAMPLE_ID=MMETSP0104 /ASSEMBLY_ACC=CAM_ASM_000202 /LENGTH=97 /DNA_ID=CAMNT_0001653681 /DNA_START=362 /DNA_END=655 /DNA_ORIENTATION=+